MKTFQRHTWVVRIDSSAVSAAALVPLAEIGFIAQDSSATWIRLEGEAELVETLSARLPGVRWQAIDGQLFRPGKVVPTEQMPELQWQPIREAVHLRVPRPAVAAKIPKDKRRTVQLVRGGTERLCGAILTTVERIVPWMESVADAGLRGLSWVVENDLQDFDDASGKTLSRCLIVGPHLPPVGGTLLVSDRQILIPAGFRWEPRISAEQIRHLFQVRSSQWLLWESNEVFTVIEGQDFCAFNRANVRSLLS